MSIVRPFPAHAGMNQIVTIRATRGVAGGRSGASPGRPSSGSCCPWLSRPSAQPPCEAQHLPAAVCAADPLERAWTETCASTNAPLPPNGLPAAPAAALPGRSAPCPRPPAWSGSPCPPCRPEPLLVGRKTERGGRPLERLNSRRRHGPSPVASPTRCPRSAKPCVPSSATAGSSSQRKAATGSTAILPRRTR